MTLSEADHEIGSLLGAAKTRHVIDLEALRHRCVQELLDARQVCEENNTLHADHWAGPAGSVHADQEHAQWVLCAAVRDIEDVDALLQLRRQEER